MENNFIFTRINELCIENNFSMYKLSKESGVALSTLSGIFSGNHLPSIPTLLKVCKTFNITLSDFFAIERSPYTLTEADMQLISAIKSLSFVKRKFLDAYITALINS